MWNVKTGDIFLCQCGDINGSSVQGGLRPVMVVQSQDYNKHSPIVVVAIITTSIKKTYMPTHIVLPENTGLKHRSMVELEQIRTIAKQQLGMYIGSVTDEQTLKDIKAGIEVMFDTQSIGRNNNENV